jgi:acyl-coenzyme A synthetase/AMP-(fatty) acid ligase
MPRGAAAVPNTSTPRIDNFPKSPAEWAAFAALPAAERSAVYLRSIRATLLFFTVLTILGIIAAVVFTLIGINAIDQYRFHGQPVRLILTSPAGFDRLARWARTAPGSRC